MVLKPGEVEFLEVVVPAGGDVHALGPYRADLIVDVHSGVQSGVYVGVKRRHVRRGDNRNQVYSAQTARFPLGKDQTLWIRNTSQQQQATVNLRYWLAGQVV